MLLKDWIKYSLGYPLVNVELTEEQYQVAYDFALQNYLAYAELTQYEDLKVLSVKAGQTIVPINNDPLLPDEKIIDFDYIAYVVYAPVSYFGLFSDFADWEKRLVMKELFGAGTMGFTGNFGYYLAVLGWLEDLRIALGQFPTYHLWNGNAVRLSPAPANDINIGIVYYNVPNIEIFEENMYFKELMLGKAMVILGEAYGKYSSIPSAGGDISLKDLISRGEAKIEKAITELKNNQMITGIYVD